MKKSFQYGKKLAIFMMAAIVSLAVAMPVSAASSKGSHSQHRSTTCGTTSKTCVKNSQCPKTGKCKKNSACVKAGKCTKNTYCTKNSKCVKNKKCKTSAACVKNNTKKTTSTKKASASHHSKSGYH